MIAGRRRKALAGGKSGLHRAECRVTPGRGDSEESATESRPPDATTGTCGSPYDLGRVRWVRLKGCGKSAPASAVTLMAR